MRWKMIAGGALLLVVLSMAALYLFLATYDYNRLKPEITRAVKDATGRELTLGGDIKLDFGLSPTLAVKDVKLANAAWGSQPQMLTADRIEAQVRLLPLLHRDVEAERIGLVGVDLFLETDPTGGGNWDFEGAAGRGESLQTDMHIDVARVSIKELNFAFRNGKTGSTTRFTLAGLDTTEGPSPDQLTADIKGTWNGQPAEIAGKIGAIRNLGKGQPFPLDLTGDVSGVKFKAEGAIGDVPNLRGMDLTVQASGTSLAGAGRALAVSLPQTDAFTVAGRLKGSAEALTLDDAQGNFSRGNVDLTINGTVGDVISLRDISLQLTGSGKDLAELGPIIDVSLPRTGPFIIQGRLTGSPKALSLTEAQGNVSRERLSLAAHGKVEDLLSFKGVDLEVTATGREFAEIGTLISTKLPELGSFDLSGHLTGSRTALALEGLSAIVGKSDLNGSAKVEFRKRPKITLVLASGLIDFTPLIRESKAEEKRLAEKRGGDRRLFPDDPLPFRLLEKVDADIVLNAKRVQVREAGLELARLTLTIDDSELGIDTLEAVYKGAKISGYAHFYPRPPPTIATKFLVQNFDLGSFLRETGASDEVEGHLDIAADVKSRGDSVRTLMANLDGTAGAVMGRGYVSKYLDLLGMDLSRKVIPFWGSNREAGRVKCGVIQFDLKNGLATSQAFVFDTELTVLTGEGDINLATEQVNFLLSPKPKDPSLFSLATKLRVGGTIQDPTVRPDMLSLATKGVKFLGALAVGPVGLLAPFVNLGAHEKHPCEIGSIGK